MALRRALAALAACVVAAPALAQDEVPFVVTPDNVTVAMLELAQVGPRDFVLDLGSGDGRIVITAARRFGARGLGVEIVPDLVAASRRHAERAGVADRAQFVVQDLFEADLGRASVITMYLLPEVNLQLRPKLLGLAPGTRIVSHDWDMDDWAPDRSRVVEAPDKTIGREKRSRLYLWVVPAAVDGAWCARTGAGPARLQLAQRFQRVQGSLSLAGDTRVLHGRLDGRRLHSDDLDATHDGRGLQVVRSRQPALRGQRFERCPG